MIKIIRSLDFNMEIKLKDLCKFNYFKINPQYKAKKISFLELHNIKLYVSEFC